MLDSTYNLIILRHAEALNDGLSDIARPLSPNGLLMARQVGTWLAKCDHIPSQILCSNSLRTQQTLEQVLQVISTPPVHYDEKIYLAQHGADLLTVLKKKIDRKSKTALLVGHNPAISSLLEILTGEPTALRTGDCHVLRLVTSSWDLALESTGLWEKNSAFTPHGASH